MEELIQTIQRILKEHKVPKERIWAIKIMLRSYDKKQKEEIKKILKNK